MLSFSALEVIGEQEKVLQDTRDFFNKTVAYFAIETSVSAKGNVWIKMNRNEQNEDHRTARMHCLLRTFIACTRL